MRALTLGHVVCWVIAAIVSLESLVRKLSHIWRSLEKSMDSSMLVGSLRHEPSQENVIGVGIDRDSPPENTRIHVERRLPVLKTFLTTSIAGVALAAVAVAGQTPPTSI